MKKLISLLSVIALIIPLLFVNALASNNELEQEIIRLGVTFPLNQDKYFNYIYIDDTKLSNVTEEMDNFSNMIFLEDDTIKISIHIGGEYYIKLNYTIENYNITLITFSFLDDVFLEIDSNKNVKSHSLDLRNIDFNFKFNRSGITKKWSNPDNGKIAKEHDLFETYEVFFGFEYLNAILIFESDYHAECELDDAPTVKYLMSKNHYNKNALTFMIGGYDNNSSGYYSFKLGSLYRTGQLYLTNYEINIKGKDVLTCDDVNIKCLDFISKADYIKNHVFLNGEHVNIADCDVYSDYYNYSTHYPGQYSIQVEMVKDNKLLVAKGIIYVTDDETPPEIIGDTEITDNISDLRDIFAYLKTYKAIDAVDGDVSNTIVVSNLNEYDASNPKAGNYKFLITAKDNSNHEGKLYVIYHVIDDTTPKASDNDDNITPTTSVIISTTTLPTESSIIPVTTTTIENTISSSIISTSENKERIINDVKDNDIEFIIKTDTSTILTKEDIKSKLAFYGLIADDFKGEIQSDYFELSNEVGEYLVTTSDDNGKHYYMIQVTSNKKEVKQEEKKDDNTLIITFGIIISIVVIVFIVIIVLLNKKKLNN